MHWAPHHKKITTKILKVQELIISFFYVLTIKNVSFMLVTKLSQLASLATTLMETRLLMECRQMAKVQDCQLFHLLSQITSWVKPSYRAAEKQREKGKGHFPRKIILSNVYYNFKCQEVCLGQGSLYVTYYTNVDTDLSSSSKDFNSFHLAKKGKCTANSSRD